MNITPWIAPAIYLGLILIVAAIVILFIRKRNKQTALQQNPTPQTPQQQAPLEPKQDAEIVEYAGEVKEETPQPPPFIPQPTPEPPKKKKPPFLQVTTKDTNELILQELREIKQDAKEIREIKDTLNEIRGLYE